MKSFLTRPATLGALTLCALFTVILASRCVDTFDASGTVSVATQQAIDILPPNTIAVGMLNVDEARSSEIAQDLGISELTVDNIDNEAGALLRDFAAETGFDPVNDVNQVYFTVADNGGSADAAALIYGQASSERIREYIDSRFADSFRRDDYRGVAVYSIGNGDEVSFAFINDEVAAVSPSRPAVTGMVDRMLDGVQSPNKELNDLVARVADSGAWMVVQSIQNYISDGLANDVDRRLAIAEKAVGRMAVGIDIDSDEANVRAYLGPADNIAVGDLEDIVKGAVAAVRTAAAPEKPIIADLLDRVRVGSSSGVVTVRLTVDSEDIEQFKSLAARSH